MFQKKINQLSFLFFLLAGTLGAQQTPNAAPGFRAAGVYDFNGIDNVSLFNGSLSLNLPLGIAYPVGGGFSYRLGLQYASTFWDTFTYSSPCPAPSKCPVEFQPKAIHDAGLGWRLNLPRLMAPGGWNQTTAWIYTSAGGGEHTFYDTLHTSDSDDPGDGGSNQLVQYSRDGSYLRFQRATGTATTVMIELPGGDLHTFVETAGIWRLTRMEDRFGNGVDLSRAADGNGNILLTLHDGLREQTITFADQGASFPNQRLLISKIELAAFDSTVATYSFTYATKTVNRPAAHNHPSPTDRTLAVRVLQKITLPGSFGAYTMGTVANPAYRAEGYLTQLRLPTLGYLEWDWVNFTFPKLRTLPPNQEEDERVEPFNSVFGVSKRRQKGINGGVLGEWTYERVLTPGLFAKGELPEKLTVTVKRPLGDKSEHFFSVYPAKGFVGQPAPQWGTNWNEYSLPYTRSEQDPLDTDRFLSSKLFDCNTNGTACERVRSVYVAYELDDDHIQNDKTGLLFNKNRRLKEQRTVDHYTDSNGNAQTDSKLSVSSDFDGLGHYRSTTVSSDFGATRSSHTEFDRDRGTYPGTFSQIPKTTPWITGLYDFNSTTENGQTAKQEFCFDPDTGFLERLRVIKNSVGNRTLDDVVQAFTADSQGQTVAQFWYGGDTTQVGTGELCNLSLGTSSLRLSNTHESGVLKTSRYAYHDGSADLSEEQAADEESLSGPLSFYNVNHTSIDVGTSLVKTSRSPSGLATSYNYDALGRLRAIKPEAGSRAAWTKIWFGTAVNSAQPARAEVRELDNGSLNNNDALTEKRYRWDGLGRLERERVLLPSSAGAGFSDRFHRYDAEGRAYSVSTWGVNGTTATESRDFDAFGRPAIVYPPDASPGDPDHKISLSYEGFRKITRTVKVGTQIDEDEQVAESDVSRTEEYDAYGRLIAVSEPSGPSGATVRTSYAYDLADRLVKVTMPVGGGHQQRTWSYDQRGFLSSECHPEKGGSSGGGCTTYSDYTPIGQAKTVVDGPFTRKYSYDRAGGRITAIHDGSDRLLKSFSYGMSSTTANRENAQLVEAINHQYPDFGNGERRQSFVETFQYGGIGGARDHRKVTWFRQCEPGETIPDCQDDGFCEEESFEHDESYDPTGKISAIHYPQCVSSDGGCGSAHPRSVIYTYEDGTGFLSDIPGWVDSVSYHKNMTVSEIHHANGIVDVIGRDPDHLARPGSMHVESAAGETLWESGTFRFDGAGNLLEMAGADFSDRFVYDGVSRLAQSLQWIRRSPNAGVSIFADTFESGDLTAWAGGSEENFPADDYSEQLFTYDVPGNLKAITTDGSSQIHSVSSTTNRLTGTAVYDTAGNLTQYTDGDGVTETYTFDALNRLAKRTRGDDSTLYFYTADDERILRFGSNGLQWTLRDLSGRLLREFRPEANKIQPIRDHIYRGSGLLATVNADSAGNLTEIRHQSLDHLGSPRYITDASGNFVSEHKYYPFGEEATKSTQDELPMKFTGHERDFNGEGEEDDLDYMHARYCDPQLGRFLSVDPVLGNPVSPQSWNGFAYARGNPIVFTDPTGRYVTNCSKEDKACNGNAEAFEAARQELLASDDAEVVAAATAWGDPGVKNGVIVSFEDPGEDRSGSVLFDAPWSNKTGALAFEATAKISPAVNGISLNETVGHEGQHIVDALRFFSALSADPNNYDMSKNLRRFQSEMNAFRISHKILFEAGVTANLGCKGCDLGRGGGRRQQKKVDAIIRKILADPKGNYRVTETNPGYYQFQIYGPNN